MIDIFHAQALATARAELWHKPQGITQWSTLEWTGAMCGEAGEAANIAKKLRRCDLEIYNKGTTDFVPQNRSELKDKFGRELADTFIYLLTCASREGLDLEYYVAKVFNDKSREAGFPQRLHWGAEVP